MEVTSDHVISEFKRFRISREICLQQLVDCLPRRCNLKNINKANTVELFRAYLLDPVTAVHETAVVGLARFSSLGEGFALHLIDSKMLQLLMDLMKGREHRFKSAVLNVMRCTSKHSGKTAQGVINSGGLQCIMECLKDGDSRIMQSAARALVDVVKHGMPLIEQVIDAGAMPALLMGLRHACVQVKLYCACVLGEMGQHSPSVVEILNEKNFRTIIKCVGDRELSCRVLTLRTLTTLCKCDISVVHNILRHNIIPYVLNLTTDDSDMVKRNAAKMLREVTKHSVELSRLVANQGGIYALLHLVTENPSSVSLPGIVTLGNMAGYCWKLAMTIVREKGVFHLTQILEREPNNNMLAATIHTLGALGKHSPEHVRDFHLSNTYSKLIEIFNDGSRSLEVRTNCKQTLKLTIGRCISVEVLEVLLRTTSRCILKYVLRQLALVLPQEPCARRFFVKKDALKAIEALDVEPESKAMKYIQTIKDCIPKEMVAYYGCGDFDDFMDQTQKYMPQKPFILVSIETSKEDVRKEIECHEIKEDEILMDDAVSEDNT